MGQVRLFGQPLADAVKNTDKVPIRQAAGDKTATRQQLLLATAGESLVIGTDAVSISLLGSGQILIHDGDPVAGLVAEIDVPEKVIRLHHGMHVEGVNAAGQVALIAAVDAGGHVLLRNLASTDSNVYYGNAAPGNVNGELHYQTRGEDRLIVDGSGNIGVGRAPTTAKLAVAGDLAIEGKLRVGAPMLVSGIGDPVGAFKVYDLGGTLLGILPLYAAPP